MSLYLRPVGRTNRADRTNGEDAHRAPRTRRNDVGKAYCSEAETGSSGQTHELASGEGCCHSGLRFQKWVDQHKSVENTAQLCRSLFYRRPTWRRVVSLSRCVTETA